jgi:selenide,water dikinase
MTNRTARPGDLLVLTKALGTGFVTTAFKAGKCPDAVLQAAVESMIQLNDVGQQAAEAAGASAATDITGFGLAGHAREMADASRVTFVLQVSNFPELPGAAALADAGFMTRASASNRQFAVPTTRIEATDTLKLEFAFDAQTSGGLLISVAADRAAQLVEHARSAGALATCIIGRVESRQDTALVIEP